jgi:hypothetical protein
LLLSLLLSSNFCRTHVIQPSAAGEGIPTSASVKGIVPAFAPEGIVSCQPGENIIATVTSEFVAKAITGGVDVIVEVAGVEHQQIFNGVG